MRAYSSLLSFSDAARRSVSSFSSGVMPGLDQILLPLSKKYGARLNGYNSFYNVNVLIGDGQNNFTNSSAGNGNTLVAAIAIALADMNGDGFADYIVGASQSANFLIGLGKGDKTFAAPAFYSEAITSSIVTGDFNLDGKTDLAVAPTNSTTLQIFLNSGCQ